jgi:hypothetical protein
MKLVQYGIKIVWGNMPVPALPDNWTIRRVPKSATVAISPEGEEYLIGEGVLYPWLEHKYLDTHNPIKL